MVEWFGWTVRGIERGFALGYAVFMLCWYLLTFRHWWAGVVGIFVIFGPMFTMWRLSLRSNRDRYFALIEWRHILLRVMGSIFILGLTAVPVLAPPHLKRDALLVAGNLCYVLVIYSTDLPSGGEPGKRRKLALAKLKELFGGWMPEPVPENG